MGAPPQSDIRGEACLKSFERSRNATLTAARYERALEMLVSHLSDEERAAYFAGVRRIEEGRADAQ